jgi:hypothetical protein
LVGKPERKRPMGRPRHRWEDNISNHKGVIKPSNTTIAVIKLFIDYNRFGPL